MKYKDVQEYNEWRRGIDLTSTAIEDVLLDGYLAMKVLAKVKFNIATIQDEGEKIAAIEEEASHWRS